MSSPGVRSRDITTYGSISHWESLSLSLNEESRPIASARSYNVALSDRKALSSLYFLRNFHTCVYVCADSFLCFRCFIFRVEREREGESVSAIFASERRAAISVAGDALRAGFSCPLEPSYASNNFREESSRYARARKVA